jgi:hypothetical protein
LLFYSWFPGGFKSKLVGDYYHQRLLFRPYPSKSFGSAIGVTGEQYERYNGFSNYFWGWGQEAIRSVEGLINECKKGHPNYTFLLQSIREGPNYKKYVVTDAKDASYMSLDADQRPEVKTNPPIM